MPVDADFYEALCANRSFPAVLLSAALTLFPSSARGFSTSLGISRLLNRSKNLARIFRLRNSSLARKFDWVINLFVPSRALLWCGWRMASKKKQAEDEGGREAEERRVKRSEHIWGAKWNLNLNVTECNCSTPSDSSPMAFVTPESAPKRWFNISLDKKSSHNLRLHHRGPVKDFFSISFSSRLRF